MKKSSSGSVARERARELAMGLGDIQASEEVLKARDDFAFFCGYVTRNSPDPATPAEHHLEWHKHLVTGKDSKTLLRIAGDNVDLLAPRGSAKAQPLYEKVLTLCGWVEMRDIKVGDYVISQDGTPTQVTRVHPQGVKSCYRVTFTDGSSVECSDDHLWTVRNLAGGNPRAFKVLDLNHIRTKVFVKSSGGMRGRVVETIYREATPQEKPWLDYRGYAKYHIPIVQPIQFPELYLPVHPYLLGVLIGDGSIKYKDAVCFSTGDEEMLTLVQECLPNGLVVKRKGTSSNYSISKQIRFGQRENAVLDGLRTLGLSNCGSLDKFIPPDYLFTSVKDRIALLQGLMDTDGCVAGDRGGTRSGGGNLTFCTISKQLLEGIVHLVQSLGGVATVHAPQKNWYTHNGEKRQGQTSYRIGIKLPWNIQPFRLQRKLTRYKPCTKLLPTRGITNIEYVGETEMQCITVAHKSQLYITSNYIVTHNSTVCGLFIAWAIGIHTLAKKPLQILYLSYSLSAARAKSSTIKSIIESAEYKEIFPSVIPGKKWSDEYWSIDREYAGIKSTGAEEFTMACAGISGGITSKRSTLVLLDDPIKSADQIANPEIRLKMERNWTTVVRPTLLEGGRVICLGTRFRPDDIHATTFTPEKGWTQIEQRAILTDDDGNERSYWEPMWSLEYLQKLRKDEPLSFSLQFQNLLVRVDEMGLDPSWIHLGNIPSEFDSFAVGIDLASSLKQKADYTVMMLLGRSGDKFYFLDYRRGKWTGNLEKLDALLELYNEWAEPDVPFTVFVESVAYQASFKGDFTTYVVNEKQFYDIHCVPWIMKGDKLAHLMSVTGSYANGAIIYNKFRFRKEDEVIKELTHFGSMQHDDVLDATCLALQGLGARRKLQAI